MDRQSIASELAELVSAWGAGNREVLGTLFLSLMADLDDDAVERSILRMQQTGQTWGYHAPDELARRISRAVLPDVLEEDSALHDTQALDDARDRPTVLAGNHLSFVDVNVLDTLAVRSGYSDIADRVTALVGPKVFTHPVRRLASLCFGTIKLPQSPSRASGEAVMPAREVARLATHTIHSANERLVAGDRLLVFPEGTRSRASGLQRLLPAVSRYLEHDDALLVPFGHSGSEKLLPIDEDHVYRARVEVRLGRAIPVRDLRQRCGRKRPLIADVVGFLIADLLPAPYRGAYARPQRDLEPARAIANDLGA